MGLGLAFRIKVILIILILVAYSKVVSIQIVFLSFRSFCGSITISFFTRFLPNSVQGKAMHYFYQTLANVRKMGFVRLPLTKLATKMITANPFACMNAIAITPTLLSHVRIQTGVGKGLWTPPPWKITA